MSEETKKIAPNPETGKDPQPYKPNIPVTPNGSPNIPNDKPAGADPSPFKLGPT